MKKILVPFDFSKPAINAYRFALDVAAQAKGSIQLIHVIELPVLQNAGITSILDFEEQLLIELKEKATMKFKKITVKYKSEGVNVKWTVAFGVLSRTIPDLINDQYDLVIMGSHGASGFREYLIGSNTEKIIRKSSVPVLTIKHFFQGVIKNIVFPNILDTEDQEDLVMKVKALQHFFKAQLHIVRSIRPSLLHPTLLLCKG